MILYAHINISLSKMNFCTIFYIQNDDPHSCRVVQNDDYMSNSVPVDYMSNSVNMYVIMFSGSHHYFY